MILEIKYSTESLPIEAYTDDVRYSHREDFREWLQMMEEVAGSDISGALLEVLDEVKEREDLEEYNPVGDYVDELLEYATLGDMEDLAYMLDLELKTVGYSPWSWAIFRAGLYEYANDLYNGWNLYDFTAYDLEGDELVYSDTLVSLYLPNDEIMEQTIQAEYGDDVKLIENEITKELDLEKVQVKTFRRII